MNKSIKAAIIGGSGFTGLELIKILFKHRFVKISLATSNTYRGFRIDDVFPSFNVEKNTAINTNLMYKATDGTVKSDFNETDVVFLCLPPLESMDFVKRNLMEFNGVIIDIGSDFRLKDPDNFKVWYGAEHKLGSLLDEFVYGLPEIYRSSIKRARKIANPGCYPTSAILAMAPVLINKNCNVKNIIIDTKSGVSGAGRKIKKEYLYCSINENFFAYSATMHRHTGEIEQEFKNLSGIDKKVSFTPHLMPLNRGIFTSIYCNLEKNGKRTVKKDEILKIYDDFYRDCIFIKLLGEKIPQLKDVTGTNYCQIGFIYDNRTGVLKIFSAIDNLLKGAAGQAVQNMNLIFNFYEGEGLDGQGIFS